MGLLGIGQCVGIREVPFPLVDWFWALLRFQQYFDWDILIDCTCIMLLELQLHAR